MFVHLATLAGNPTSDRPETATAYTGGRLEKIQKERRKIDAVKLPKW
jgi:hypothetical protein